MIDVSATLINEYQKCFTGHTNFYGSSKPTGEIGENGKLKMISLTKTVSKGDAELTYKQYKAHLEGKMGLGIAPIDKDSMCNFAAIDIDDYKLKPDEFLSIVIDYSLPFCLFRSKSGGLHCYIFFDIAIKASLAREVMRNYLIIFGLPKSTEIYPRQDRLFGSGAASWINLPYFGGTDSYMYESNDKGYSLEAALYHIHDRRISYERIKETYEGLPLSNGPMCLQSLFIRSNTMQDGDGRNNYLFNMGIYYKVSDASKFEGNIIEANNKLLEPKSDVDINNQIIKPIQKKSYTYRCSDHPLCDNCYPELCRERMYGKGSDEISSLSFEELVQVKTKPPHYVWIINGKEMIFYKEKDLREQHIFADQCMRLLHVVPNQIKQRRWIEILNKAFESIVIRDVDPDDDISPGAMLVDYLREYLLDRPPAQNRVQIKIGYIYKDMDSNIYVFRKKNFLNFIQHDKQFRYFQPTEIQKRLQDFGVGAKIYHIDKGHKERVWYIPIKLIRQDIQLQDDKINFEDIKPKENDF